MVISALVIPASLVVQILRIVLALKQMQIRQIIPILTRNFSRITLLLRFAVYVQGLICRELALNVLGDGSIGTSSLVYFLIVKDLGYAKCNAMFYLLVID